MISSSLFSSRYCAYATILGNGPDSTRVYGTKVTSNDFLNQISTVAFYAPTEKNLKMDKFREYIKQDIFTSSIE
jgi:hypothetical protein